MSGILSGAFAPAFVPPPQAAPRQSPDGVLSDREAVLREMQLPNVSGAGSIQEIPVYSTVRRWRGCDVYVDASQVSLAAGQFISVGIYAVARGVRQLVASGRSRGSSGRLASVRRAIAERFDVTVAFNGVTTGSDRVQVAVVAADEALPDPDPLEGRISLTNDGLLESAAASLTVQTPIPFELVALNAAANVGANLFLNVHGVTAPAGLAPVFSFGNIQALGDTLHVDSPILRAQRFSPITVAVSSSAAATVLAAAGAVVFNGWVR